MNGVNYIARWLSSRIPQLQEIERLRTISEMAYRALDAAGTDQQRRAAMLAYMLIGLDKSMLMRALELLGDACGPAGVESALDDMARRLHGVTRNIVYAHEFKQLLMGEHNE